MRVRNFFIASLAACFAAAAPVAPDTNPQPTKSRWVVKTSLPGSPGNAKKVELADLMALPSIPGVGMTESKPGGKYNENRIPASVFEQSGLHEGKMVKTIGYMHLVAYEKNDDDDYHIQITTELSDKDHQPASCLVVELPQPDTQHVVDANLRATFSTERDFFKTKLLKGNDPSTSGSVMQHPVYVEVTGQLFYDGWHAANPGSRGKKKCKASTAWELHPITKIKFAPTPH